MVFWATIVEDETYGFKLCLGEDVKAVATSTFGGSSGGNPSRVEYPISVESQHIEAPKKHLSMNNPELVRMHGNPGVRTSKARVAPTGPKPRGDLSCRRISL